MFLNLEFIWSRSSCLLQEVSLKGKKGRRKKNKDSLILCEDDAFDCKNIYFLTLFNNPETKK